MSSVVAESIDGESDGRSWTTVETLRRGWRASPELHQGAAVTVVCAALGAAGRLVLPVLIQLAVDRGIRSPLKRGSASTVDMVLVARLCLFGAVAVVVSQLFARAAVVRLGRRSERALYQLRCDVFGHIHDLSVGQQAEFRKGALVSRVISDLDTLSQFLSWGGLAWMLDGALMIATAIAMYLYDPLLATIVIVTTLPLFVLLRGLQHRLVTAYGAVREENASYLNAVSELVTGAAVVRAYDATDARLAITNRHADRLKRAAVVAGSWSALLFPIGEIFSVLAIGALVAVGVARGAASGLTSGAMVGFVFLAYRFLEPVGEFTEILDQTQTAVAGWRRVLSVLDTTSDVAEPANPTPIVIAPPTIELEAVTFAYRSRPGEEAPDAPALIDVTVSIAPGERVAVVGATGSGKSTFARLVARLVDPTDGAVVIAGVDAREIANVELRRLLLLVPQEPFLFAGTIAENVRYARPNCGAHEIEAAFAELGIDGWFDSLPNGLGTQVGERGDELSAGERQLVALARAQLASPACLVLDEATSSVDPGTEATLARALDRLSSGRTTITIAHRLSTAMRADRVLVFEAGRLVQLGRHDELVALPGAYADLYASWVSSTGT
jgi:ATP-binding cassette, subfamily B, bacterial